MSWEPVTAMLVAFARERRGYGGLRTWFGPAPAASGGAQTTAIARLGGYVVAPSETPFMELTPDEALQVITFIAVDSLVMPSGKAAPHELVEIFAQGLDRLGPQTRFFSNGPWHEYTRSRTFGCNPISDAAFDAGLIGLGSEVAFLAWVEEED